MTLKRLFAVTLTATLAFTAKSQTTNVFPSSGNAGIGITSPSVPFEIGSTLNQGDQLFKFGNPQQYNQIIFRDRSNSSFLFGAEIGQIKIGLSGTEHKLMSTQYNAHNIELWPTVAFNSPSNILINAGQNVGIGNTNPQYKLDVSGTVNATQYYINGSPLSGLTGLWLTSTTNSTNIYYNSGNVGIGTNAPTVPFQIGTTLSQGSPVFNFGNPQQYNQIIFRDRSNSSFLYGAELGQVKIGLSGSDHKIMSTQYNAQNIELWPTVAVNSPSNILINAGQNVGIGNTNPQYKLDVTGTVNATQYLVNGNPLATLSGTGNSFSLPATASLGIGTSSPQFPLDVAGDARVQNNLYVGGGILISQEVRATKSLKTDTVHSTSGQTNFTSKVVLKQQFQVDGTSLFNGNLQASDLNVTGAAYFNNGIQLPSLAGTGDNIVYVDANGNLKVGTSGANVGAPGSCLVNATPWYQGGNNNSLDVTAGTCDNTDFILKANNVNSFWIKPSGKIGFNTPNPNARLEITGSSSTDGIRYNSPTSAGSAFEIATTGGASAFSRFKTYGNGQTFIGQFITPANDFDVTGSALTIGQSNVNYKAINIVNNTNPSAPTDLFSVYGSGVTEISTKPTNVTDNVFTIKNTILNTINYNILADGKTQIGAGQFLSANKLLTVNGDVLFANNGTTAGGHQYDGYSGFEIVGGDRVPVRRGISVEDDPNGDLSFFINSNQSTGGPQFRFKNGAGSATSAGAIPDLFVINQNGTTKINVYGANSTTVFDAFTIWDVTANKPQYKVKSNGYVYAREINVQLAAFPDYVFAKGYKLQSLESLETYINKNKHLPNMPSAKEVEENGANLGEIQKATVEKTEELFLYLFELNKRIEKLEKENKELKATLKN